MATYYRWMKSEIEYSENTSTVNNPSTAFPTEYWISNGKPTLNTSTGLYTLSTQMDLPNSSDSRSVSGYYVAPSQTSSIMYYGESSVFISGRTKRLQGTFTCYTAQLGKGTFVGYVYSTSSTAYPNGGVSGNYYYDQRTTVTSPTAPTGLTYPNPITTPTVTVSWNAASSNVPDYSVNLYEVSYSTNGGSSWTVAGTTASTSYSFDIPAGTTSIAFRVRARDSNNQWGNYVTGTASQVLLAPTLTVPSQLMQGQQATINWTAIEGADSYTVQRKANTDADWVQVYSGSATTFSETVGTWTSVQYRVCAVFGSTSGGWAESAAIPVVSASALVISGTDSDLGTLVNDVPYSISTDTGNQITATITVNSAVIFSGNVGNSTAGTIPVLDLVNGQGTIVIEASVQATSGTVSAVRTWTYTKAPITFPNAGSVAQLTQQGANIWPKTLAECVRLPGGKTLDEVTGFPCQVYSGSYVGTGTYGASNPNTLTFPFDVKMVLISAVNNTASNDRWGLFNIEILTDEYTTGAGNQFGTIGSSASVGSGAYAKYSNKTLTWYHEMGATTQINTNGMTYRYVAIG